MANCSNCGSELAEGSRICQVCGSPVTQGPPQPGWQAPPPGQGGQPGQAPPGQPWQPSPGQPEQPPPGQQGQQPHQGYGQQGGYQVQYPYGQPQQFPGGTGTPQTDGQAIAALVCGIIGIVACPVIFSIIALVLGKQSEKKIAASGGALTGEQMAKAGWILGIIGLALSVIGILFFVFIFMGAAMQGI